MKLIRAALGLLLPLIIFGAGQAMPPDQPNMTAARTDLQQARAQLLTAEHNKGGHRAKAVEYVNAAIAEVNRGINFDKRHGHAGMMSAAAIFSAASTPDQPHMRAALENLRSASNNLERATSDKGGHRVKAIDLVNRAIEEVNAGIAAGA